MAYMLARHDPVGSLLMLIYKMTGVTRPVSQRPFHKCIVEGQAFLRSTSGHQQLFEDVLSSYYGNTNPPWPHVIPDYC